MVRKSVFTKQQSQEQVNPDDEGEDDLNIADDVTQPMALEQVVAEEDSKDEDDDVADLEDQRMLDDFIDVTQYEKHMMHLWNSFIRKQRVLADAHASWACEAYSDIHGEELVLNPKFELYMNCGAWDPHDVNVVASTSESSIQFWDLRTMKYDPILKTNSLEYSHVRSMDYDSKKEHMLVRNVRRVNQVFRSEDAIFKCIVDIVKLNLKCPFLKVTFDVEKAASIWGLVIRSDVYYKKMNAAVGLLAGRYFLLLSVLFVLFAYVISFEDKVLFNLNWSTKSQNDHHQKSISFTDEIDRNTDNYRFIEKLKAMDSQIKNLNEELQDIRNKYNELRKGNASKNNDTSMFERHEVNYIRSEDYQNQDSHNSFSRQYHHDHNDSEKSLTELNNDVKNDLKDFKIRICSMRTVHDNLFDRDNESYVSIAVVTAVMMYGLCRLVWNIEERTFKFELDNNIKNLETQLNKETLHEKDSKSTFKVIDAQFQMFIRSEVLDPSNYNSYDLETRKDFKDYTNMEAQTLKETIIQNMDSIEQCIVERARHEQEIQNRLKRLNERKLQIQEVKASNASSEDTNSSGIISDKGNDQSLENQSNTPGDESSMSRNECNDKSTSGDDTNIRPSYDTEPMAECKSTLEETNRTLGESNRTLDRYLVALHDKEVELAKYKTFKDRTIENDTLEQKHDELVKQSLLTKSSYEGLVKEKNKYVQSLEKEIDELESDKADFSNIYDLLLQECVSKDAMCSYFHSLSDLDAHTELKCLYLHKFKECKCLAEKLSKQTKNVSKEGC
ncbi:uncharacterized mitochondrial protein-like protein [Tanacetum coccineum]|uniref:Uncharacterized mitochondrial protein-like protein n=1 Tax=Tanacetum coccineum TaxID=301880 RepID=A0ABQ5DEM8_9ASTR